jgi:hypothetical protein
LTPGYRRKLREQLRFDGYEVDMVGIEVRVYIVQAANMCERLAASHMETSTTGTVLPISPSTLFTNTSFPPSQHEGHPSMKIEHMIGFASCSINQLPNIILLHVGTNDCTGAKDDVTIARAGDGYIRLLDYLYERSPDVTVIVSTLLPNADPLGNHYVDVLNQRIRDIAVSMSKTRKMVLAEMAEDFISLDEIVDGTHPNAVGYAKMAAVWSLAIDQARMNNLITPPRDNGRENGGDDDAQCANTPPSPENFGPATETQRGSGA